MRVGVLGTGYVGLPLAVGFAEKGNDVTCIDTNAERVAMMQEGELPIYEVGLPELFGRNIREKRLHFSTDLNDAMSSDVLFLALPTPTKAEKGSPMDESGEADLSYIEKAARDIGSLLTRYMIIVTKSTVPIGTAKKVEEWIRETAPADAEFDVVSNPEFMQEAEAIKNVMNPDRVIIGASSQRAFDTMDELWTPFVVKDPSRIQHHDPATAEAIKYASNAFLATKITFMNEMAGLAEATGADIDGIRLGMGSDPRIGKDFLFAGPGFGGSCFGKDTRALRFMARTFGLELSIVNSTIDANERQMRVVPDKVLEYFNGNVEGKRIGMWGLAFKAKTDDVRESPALVAADMLTAKGATVVAFDPKAMPNAKRVMESNPNIEYAADEYAAVESVDALTILTNWDEFRSPDFARMKASMNKPVIIDGRNMYNLRRMKRTGFYYESIGRQVVNNSQGSNG